MKQKKILFNLTLSILLLLVVYHCDTTTEPTKYRPRKLKWTIDTLEYPDSFQTMLTGIWGRTKKDVYVYGHNSSGLRGKMYHYDGKKWESVALSHLAGGDLVGSFEIKTMIGFDVNDVYAAGSKHNHIEDLDYCSIIHYDGTTWLEEDIPEKIGYIKCIYGDTPDNIWALATGGTVFHYNGIEWMLDSIPHKKYTWPERSLVGISMTGNDHFGYYLSTSSVMDDHSSYNHLFYLKDNQFFAIDSGDHWDADGISELWMSPSGTLYKSSNRGVYSYHNNNWQRLTTDVRMCWGIDGTTDDNIYITAWNYEKQCYAIMHYNGEDWYDFELELGTSAFWDLCVVDDEVFVTGFTMDGYPQKTIVLHGKP